MKTSLQIKSANTPTCGLNRASHMLYAIFFLLTLGVGNVWGNVETYTFTSKSWAATNSANENANWTSGKDGNAMTSGRGVQITTGASGAKGTSPISFSNVSQVVVTYSTNASAGAGIISVTIGTNDAHSQSVTKTGGTTDRTLTYSISPSETGNIELSVTCSTNSIYVKSVSITYDPSSGGNGGGGSNEGETYTFTSKSWAATNSANENANWTSGKDGNGMTSGRGVQITTGASGANGTSPISFNDVSQVVVTYSTNASAGAGTIAIQIGSGTAQSQSVTTSGGTSDRTLTYNFSPTEAGKVKITVTCSTNSIYVKSVAITTGSGVNQLTALDVPTGMSSGTPGMTSATLSWNTVTNADSYALTIGNNTPITTGFTIANGKVSYTLNNLTADTEYTWKVKATTTNITTYSDSEDCAVQNFTTADDPSYAKVTFDFTNDTYPTGFPTSSGTSTSSATEFTFGSNKLVLNAPDGYYKFTDGSNYALFFGKTTGAYVEFPAKENYKLIKVKITNSSKCAENVPVNVYSTSGTAMSTAVNTSHDGVMTFALANSDYNSAYRVTSTTSSKNLQFLKVVLTYAPKPAVSSISIKTAPTKTIYTANENFDPSGLVITVNYSDNTSEDVAYNNTTASDFTFSPTTSAALNATNTSVTVTYANKTANQAITVNRIATTLSWSANSYAANIGSQYSFPTLTKTPSDLSGVTFESSNTDVVETISAAGVPTVKAVGTTTITAKFVQTNVYAAATDASYTLTINAASSPSLEVDPTSLTFDLTEVGQSSNEEFTLMGEYLKADATISITGTNAAMFSVAAADETIEKDANDEILANVTVTYSPTAAGNHSATLTISSTDATPVQVALSGSANVRRSVTWVTGTEASAVGGTASVWDGAAITAIPTQPTSCDEAISFMGWTDAIYAKSDDAPAHLYHQVSDFPVISGGNATYYAVWANASGSGGSMEITRNTTNFPASYAAAADYTLNGYSFNILQVYNNSNATGTGAQTMQWRASGNSNGTGTIYNKDAFPGHISSIVIVYASDDSNKNIGLNIGESANPTSGTAITPTNSGSTYTFNCSAYNFDYFVLTNGTGAGYTSSITINYAASIKDYSTICSAPVVIADPTFSPAAGSYDNDQSVTLGFASPATAVYYTTDGTSDPKTSGTLYSSAIYVTEDMTIKAAATDGNGNWSNVVTKTYTINYSPSIAAYIAKTQATTRYLRLNAAQNCVVTAVKKNNQDKVTNIYCQDNSGAGIIIYNGSGFGDNEINVGDRIVGTVSGTWSPYLKQPEMTSAVFANGTTFTAVSRPDAPTVTVANVNSGAAYTANPMMLVTIADLYYKSVNNSTYTFNTQANGEGTDITIYDNFSYLSGKTMPGVACTIVGIMARNNDTYQVLPVELTTAATAALPTISPTGGASLEADEAEVEYLSAVSVQLVENEDIYVSINDETATKLTEAASINIEGDTKIAVTAKRDFYADNTVTYFYKPSAYPKNISVTSMHGEVVVKVNQTTVSTALPGATVTFTVTPENEHFHITSTSVTYEGGSLTPSLNENVYSFEMPDKDATIVVTYNEDAKYSITFNGGGAEGEGPAAFEDQYAGTEITLPTKEEANYTAPTDKVFNGWVVTSGEDEVEQNNGKFDMPAGNVTIEAQWADRVYCALTLNINGATTTTNIDREVKYILPTEEDPISGYDFYGWTEAPEVDDVEDAIDTIKSFTPAANEASKTLYAVFKRTETGAQKTDVITAADLAATSTGYVEFSNVQKNSSAKYAGKTAKNGTNIQINDASGQCIISTTSGGLVKNVSITWGSSSNTLDVYASNTAYTAIGDLWDNSKKGTKVTSFTATGSYNFTNDYSYVGIRSSKNAIQLASVSITWQPSTTYYTTAPAVVCDVEYNLGSNPAGAWKANEGCAATKVKGGQTYIICADEPVREHHKFNGWTVGGSAVSGTITINANTEIVADWIAKAQSNVTYDAGTGSGSDVVVANVEEGTEVTLKAIGSGEGQANFTKSGYDFVGWLSNGVLYKAGETIEMPAEAVTLTAQWKKQNVEKMSLITSVEQLVSGTKIVLASKDPVLNDVVKPSALAGDLGSNKYLASLTENITFSGNEVSYTNANVLELIIEQVEDGWKLRKDATNYLKETSVKNLAWGTASDATIWTVAFSNGNANIVSSNGSMKYNAQDPRFTTYASGQKDIQIYGKATVVSTTTNISNIGYVDGDVIVLSNNATLTVDANIAPTTVIVPSGGTVTVNNNKTIDANTVIVENGGTLDIQTEGTVKTNETLIIHSTLGKGTGTGSGSGNNPGACGQIANGNNIIVNGDVYLEIELTQDAAASAGWYAFSVPFPVDAMNGVYYGETKLTNEVGYAIMSHDGALRAENKYAWKKFRGIMQPGVFYVITVGNTDYKTLRFKKVAGEALVASTDVAVSPFPTQTGNNADGAWNGIGNPNLQISNLSTSVTTMQFYDHKTNSFIGRDHSVNLVVGSAFFIQYNTTSSVSIPTEINDGHGYLAPKREQQDVENTIYKVELMNMTTDELEDNVFFTAREDATTHYEIGRDVAKLSMGAAKCAQITIPAYGTNLCVADFQLVNSKASYPLTITTPAAGDYRVELAEAYEDATIYLTYEGRVIWNLSMSPYEVELQQGQTEGYGLRLVAAPQTPTDIENTEAINDTNGVQKVIIDEHVYILRGEQLFDVTGKAAR